MEPNKRRTQVDEAITGVIGVLMVATFLGFLAVDIGSIPLIIITAVTLVMVITDLVQTVRQRENNSEN